VSIFLAPRGSLGDEVPGTSSARAQVGGLEGGSSSEPTSCPRICHMAAVLKWERSVEHFRHVTIGVIL
jgi:hypothetical protein